MDFSAAEVVVCAGCGLGMGVFALLGSLVGEGIWVGVIVKVVAAGDCVHVTDGVEVADGDGSGASLAVQAVRMDIPANNAVKNAAYFIMIP
jgi:hypothetical protein